MPDSTRAEKALAALDAASLQPLRDRLAALRRLVEEAGTAPRKSPSPPHFFDIHLTMRCMLRCRHCDIWRLPPRELSLDQLCGYVDTLARWVGPHDLHLTGGEPLLVEHLPAFLEHCRNLPQRLFLVTNGFLLDRQRLDRLLDSPVYGLVISLDGLRGLHDELRGCEGLFGRLEAALDYLAKRNGRLRVSVLTVLNGLNLPTIPALLDWTQAHPAIHMHSFQFFSQPFGSAGSPLWYREHELWPRDLGLVDEVLEEIKARRRDGARISNDLFQLEVYKHYFRDPNRFVSHRCDVGSFALTLDSSGQVFSCPRFGALGSLGDDLPRLWESPRADELRHLIRGCEVSCNRPINCNFLQNAPFLLQDLFGSELQPDWEPEETAAGPNRRPMDLPSEQRELLWQYYRLLQGHRRAYYEERCPERGELLRVSAEGTLTVPLPRVPSSPRLLVAGFTEGGMLLHEHELNPLPGAAALTFPSYTGRSGRPGARLTLYILGLDRWGEPLAGCARRHEVEVPALATDGCVALPFPTLRAVPAFHAPQELLLQQEENPAGVSEGTLRIGFPVPPRERGPAPRLLIRLYFENDLAGEVLLWGASLPIDRIPPPPTPGLCAQATLDTSLLGRGQYRVVAELVAGPAGGDRPYPPLTASFRVHASASPTEPTVRTPTLLAPDRLDRHWMLG